MYTYSINSDTTKKALSTVKNNKSVNDLLDQISDFKSNFESSGSKVVQNNTSFEKLTMPNTTDEEITKQAENELSDYKSSNIKAIEENATNKKSALEDSKTDATDNYSLAMDTASSYYKNVKENASNDALKRGLARSSIVINKLDAFNQAEINTYNALNTELTNTINSIDFEINMLSAEQESALNEFDISYAVKLSNKITELKNELFEKQADIIKYNNEIAETEANYDIKYQELQKKLDDSTWEKEQDILDLTTTYGTNLIERYKDNKIFNMIESYLDSLSTSEASAILKSNEQIQNLLTKANLNTLLEKYNGK